MKISITHLCMKLIRTSIIMIKLVPTWELIVIIIMKIILKQLSRLNVLI